MKLYARVRWTLYAAITFMFAAETFVNMWIYIMGATHNWLVGLNMNSVGEGPLEFVIFMLLTGLAIFGIYNISTTKSIWAEK